MRQDISAWIDNAIRSLYGIVIHIEEKTLLCNVIDQDDEYANLKIGKDNTYSELFDEVYRNVHPEDRDKLYPCSSAEYVHKLLSREVSVYFDCRLRDTHSLYRWVRITLCNAREAESTTGQEYLFLVQDISAQKKEEKRKEAELEEKLYDLQSRYDRLFEENMTDAQTGCYNRKGLAYYEGIVLNEARDYGRSLFVCVLDLNGLKHLNDTYGHAAGDEGIRVVSDALKQAVPEGARIVRTGGDEFLIIAAVDNDYDFSLEMETKIVRRLAAYNQTSNNPFEVSASYGFVMCADVSELVTLDELIEEADKKMYSMKVKTDPYRR